MLAPLVSSDIATFSVRWGGMKDLLAAIVVFVPWIIIFGGLAYFHHLDKPRPPKPTYRPTEQDWEDEAKAMAAGGDELREWRRKVHAKFEAFKAEASSKRRGIVR
jgi:hypothetical protein